MKTKFYRLLFVLLFVGAAHYCHAGITGTLSGTILDQQAGNVLPGAQVLVEGTTLGTMADKNGNYIIYNLPAGSYDISVSMIGYSKHTIKKVIINADVTTKLNFELSAKVLPLDEVVITDQKKLIQSDVTSSTYFVSGQEINESLPIDKYLDAVALLPGVVGNHIRGGRDTDVLYLIDGLPVQSGFSRQISSYFPNSSIVEMMVQTGGFTAEYGYATSGIVNVVSKDGRNEVQGNLKFYSDVVETALSDNDNTRRFEFNLGGPMTIGLGGPLINAHYFVAADLNLSDTAHRKELSDAFGSPIFTNYNINSKLSFDIGRNTILALQGLVSNWKWRQFDEQWALNPLGLAENKHYAHRLSAALTHTFSSRFFASLRYGNYSTKRQVLSDINNSPSDIVFQDDQDPRSQIVAGNQPWQEETVEKVHIAKVDLIGQLSKHHLAKAGIEIQDFRLETEAVKYTAIPTRSQANSLSSITYASSRDNYSYGPGSFALYLQDKISFKGITADLGLRYDVLAPNIDIEKTPEGFRLIQQQLRAPNNTKSESHTPVSPRLGLALPLSATERIHVNYGWYYQMPPLYYYYTNLGENLDSYLPLVGNKELEPTKTISTEFSYKKVVSDDLFFVVTGFTKRFENLIDTRMFILPDSLIQNQIGGNIGYTQYVNSAHAKASGFEVTLQKRITDALSARISYTFMKARGNSTGAEDGYERALSGKALRQGTEFPLSWDQRHSTIFNVDYQGKDFNLNVLYRLLSPLPFTTRESIVPNDNRLSWRNLIDLRLSLNNTRLLGGHMRPFVELRNLLNDDNTIEQEIERKGVQAYRLFDPINSNFGRRIRVGMTIDF